MIAYGRYTRHSNVTVLTRLPSHLSWNLNYDSGHIAWKMFQRSGISCCDVGKRVQKTISIDDSRKHRAGPSTESTVEELGLLQIISVSFSKHVQPTYCHKLVSNMPKHE